MGVLVLWMTGHEYFCTTPPKFKRMRVPTNPDYFTLADDQYGEQDYHLTADHLSRIEGAGHNNIFLAVCVEVF